MVDNDRVERVRREHILADTFRKIGQILIDTAMDLEPEELLIGHFPIMVEADGFNPCPRCTQYPVVLDFGSEWSAMCPQCNINIIGKTKEDTMSGWNNLKLDEEGRVV